MKHVQEEVLQIIKDNTKAGLKTYPSDFGKLSNYSRMVFPEVFSTLKAEKKIKAVQVANVWTYELIEPVKAKNDYPQE